MHDEDEIRRRAHSKFRILSLLIAAALLGIPSIVGSVTKSGSIAEARPAVKVIVR